MKRIILLALCMVFLAGLGFSAEKTDLQVKTNPQLQTKPPGGAITPGGGPHPIGTCCISGTYKGEQEDTSCVMGHTPKKGKFTMVITQVRGCGSAFTAVVTDADGHVTNFSGTVTGGAKPCCNIEGKSTTGTDNIHFKGTICKSGAKWSAKGTFTSVHCSGKWKMGQI